MAWKTQRRMANGRFGKGRSAGKSFLPAAARFAGGVASGIAARFGSGRTGTKTVSAGERTVTDSGNRREKVVYRRRRAPRRVRRRARKAAGRIARVLNSRVAANYVMLDGTAHVVVNTGTSGTAHGTQAVWGDVLYGMFGNDITTASATEFSVTTSGWSYGDVNRMMQDMNTSSANASRAVMEFQSARIEYTMSNGDSTDCFVDAYEILFRRDVDDDSVATLPQLWDVMLAAQGKSTNVTASGTVILDIDINGVTPFQCGSFGSKVLILKKRTIQIPGGATVRLELNDRKIHRFQGARMVRNILGMKGVTRGWLFVGYGRPITTGDGVVAEGVVLSCFSKRTYKVRYLAGNDLVGSWTETHAA